jgi:hypothetical protein
MNPQLIRYSERVPVPQLPTSAVSDTGWPTSTTWPPIPLKNAVQFAIAPGRPG